MSAQTSHKEYAYFDLQPTQGADLEGLVAGLQQPQKQVSPKFFYDEAGSKLFDEITQLEEYYSGPSSLRKGAIKLPSTDWSGNGG